MKTLNLVSRLVYHLLSASSAWLTFFTGKHRELLHHFEIERPTKRLKSNNNHIHQRPSPSPPPSSSPSPTRVPSFEWNGNAGRGHHVSSHLDSNNLRKSNDHTIYTREQSLSPRYEEIPVHSRPLPIYHYVSSIRTETPTPGSVHPHHSYKQPDLFSVHEPPKKLPLHLLLNSEYQTISRSNSDLNPMPSQPSFHQRRKSLDLSGQLQDAPASYGSTARSSFQQSGASPQDTTQFVPQSPPRYSFLSEATTNRSWEVQEKRTTLPTGRYFEKSSFGDVLLQSNNSQQYTPPTSPRLSTLPPLQVKLPGLIPLRVR